MQVSSRGAKKSKIMSKETSHMARPRTFRIRARYLLLYLLAAGVLLVSAYFSYTQGGPLFFASAILGAGSVSLMILVLREMIMILGLAMGREIHAEFLKGVILTVMTLGVCLVVFEGALWLHERLGVRDGKARTAGLPLTMPDELKQRPAQIPNAKKAYYWQGKLHVYDANEMRRTTPFPAKRDDTFRIMAVGDSLTYGLGIAAEETYSRVLEKDLRKTFQVEVLNLGICGINSEEVAETVERFAPQLKPDLITYGICLNDFLPRSMPNVEGYPFPLPDSFKQMMVEHTRVGQFLNHEYNDLLLRLNLMPDLTEKVLHRFPSYSERLAKDLRAMNTFAMENGYGPMITAVLDQWPTKRRRQLTEFAEKAAAEAGMIVVSTADFYRKHNNKKKLAKMVVNRWELHPNERTHAEFAGLFLSVVCRLPALQAYAFSPTSNRVTRALPGPQSPLPRESLRRGPSGF